jgi:hypothetical protein
VAGKLKLKSKGAGKRRGYAAGGGVRIPESSKSGFLETLKQFRPAETNVDPRAVTNPNNATQDAMDMDLGGGGSKPRALREAGYAKGGKVRKVMRRGK